MIIGITGGIGSGKSLVTDYLREHYGFSAVKTDDLAREMMISDRELKDQLKKAFGSEIYLPDGSLDKKRYAALIHGCSKNRMLSDSIVHPAVWKRIRMLIKTENGHGRDEVCMAVETALPGKELRSVCDEIWHIRTDEKVRIRRLILDRGYTETYARSVISGQASGETYSALADRVIDNSRTVDELNHQIDLVMKLKGKKPVLQ